MPVRLRFFNSRVHRYLPVIWIGTLLKNFPMALLWNLFAASPMSRICLKLIFPELRKQG